MLAVVTGTAEDDVFRIDLDRGEYRLNHGPWQRLTSAVSFDGLGGRDTVHVVGTSGNETATLYGSAGADRAVRRPSADSGLVSLRDEAGTYLLKVLDFETVALRGEGGGDSVEIHGETDGANQFQFSAASLHAVMDSGTVTTTADGFETVSATVRGRGGASGDDTAVLTGTAASDTYAGDLTSGELTGNGFLARVAGFDDVTVYGGGGYDRADLVSSGPCPTVSPADDWAESVQISDGRHSQRVVEFRLVKATVGIVPDAIEVASLTDRVVGEDAEPETIPLIGENLSGATLSLVNSNPELVTASLDGTSLVLDYVPHQHGVARIGLRGDLGGSSVFTDFFVTVVDPVTVETVQDGAEGGQSGQFRFTRTDSTGYLTVDFTIGGTATNGSDYSQISTSYNSQLGMYVASATFSSGQSTTTVNVSPVDDAAVEGNETVIATLQAYSGCCCCCGGGGGYTVGSPSSATVTIQDNDSANDVPTASSVLSASAESVVFLLSGAEPRVTVAGRVPIDWAEHYGPGDGTSGEVYSGFVDIDVGGMQRQPCDPCASNAGAVTDSGVTLNQTADDLETGTGGCASCGGSTTGTGIIGFTQTSQGPRFWPKGQDSQWFMSKAIDGGYVGIESNDNRTRIVVLMANRREENDDHVQQLVERLLVEVMAVWQKDNESGSEMDQSKKGDKDDRQVITSEAPTC